MSSINTSLTELGLNEKEINVYLACLELGTASVAEIAKKSGVKRTSIYNFLEDLKNKGLISEIKKNRKTLLLPEDPHALILNRQNQIKKTEEQIKSLGNLIPSLMAIYNAPGSKAKITYLGLSRLAVF